MLAMSKRPSEEPCSIGDIKRQKLDESPGKLVVVTIGTKINSFFKSNIISCMADG